MGRRSIGGRVGSASRSRDVARSLAIVWLTAAVLLAPGLWAGTSRASVVDSHVLRFEAGPSYINLGMVTTVTLEIGTSYGAGLDTYRATVTAPDATAWSAWFNFTAVGPMALPFGNRTAGFQAGVDQVGTYSLVAEHFDGLAFAPAAYAELLTTDLLTVDTEAAAASNEYTDIHNCPVAQEFQRGGEIMGRAYVRYASTGEFVNGTKTKSAVGNITGTMLGLTQVLRWHNVNHFWRWAWFPTWDAALGVIAFSVDARDGLGNHGTGTSPAGGSTAWRIIPAVLKVVPRILNGTGAETVVFASGDTIRVEARVTYESHNQHNRIFPGPMNTSRGGVVTAALGYGAYNATSGQFQYPLTSVTLTLDPTTQNWSATYQVRSTDPIRTDLQAVVSAHDAAPVTPNTGMAFSTRFSIRAPATTPPVTPAPTGLDPILAGFAAVVALVAGLGIGLVVARRRSKPAQGKEPAKEDEDDWVVEDEKEGKQ